MCFLSFSFLFFLILSSSVTGNPWVGKSRRFYRPVFTARKVWHTGLYSNGLGLVASSPAGLSNIPPVDFNSFPRWRPQTGNSFSTTVFSTFC